VGRTHTRIQVHFMHLSSSFGSRLAPCISLRPPPHSSHAEHAIHLANHGVREGVSLGLRTRNPLHSPLGARHRCPRGTTA
jgi:hypothetical protein